MSRRRFPEDLQSSRRGRSPGPPVDSSDQAALTPKGGSLLGSFPILGVPGGRGRTSVPRGRRWRRVVRSWSEGRKSTLSNLTYRYRGTALVRGIPTESLVMAGRFSARDPAAGRAVA